MGSGAVVQRRELRCRQAHWPSGSYLPCRFPPCPGPALCEVRVHGLLRTPPPRFTALMARADRAPPRPCLQGLSYLEVKHLMMLHYCAHIVFYILLKAEGRPVRDHPVMQRCARERRGGSSAQRGWVDGGWLRAR